MLLILLIFITNCNKVINLANKYKFRLNESQEENIKKGNVEALKDFIKSYGKKKNDRSHQGEVPILYIIKYFNSFNTSEKEKTEQVILEYLKPYIESGDWIEYDKKGNTPLHYCLKKNYFQIAKALLEKTNKFSLDIQSIRNDEKDNPLYLAIEQENYKFINLFLEHMEDINKPFKYILTPLIFATLSGKDDIVKLLIEKGAIIKDITDLRMIVASDLNKKLKIELIENYIKSLDRKTFESNLWIFKTSKANNFNLTVDHINEEINPKKSFRHYSDQELEIRKQEINKLFDKYNIKKVTVEEVELDTKEKNLNQNKKKIFSRIFKKIKF